MAVVVLLALSLSAILLATHAPRRFVFLCYQRDFDNLLPQAPMAGDRAVVQLHANLDLFWVDQWGTDNRGGTYFRTMTSGGNSYGFAHQPNQKGSPFGDENYRLHHMTDDWYSFAASDGP